MKNIQDIAIAEYDYPLPDERIAKYPSSLCSVGMTLRATLGQQLYYCLNINSFW